MASVPGVKTPLFGEKIALHKTPNPPKTQHMECGVPLTRPDAAETKAVLNSLWDADDDSSDVVVLSSQKQALVDAGVAAGDILETSEATQGDQPDVILTDEDASRARKHYQGLSRNNPDQARQYADGVAKTAELRIYQEKPAPNNLKP